MNADHALRILSSALDDTVEDSPEREALAVLERVVAMAHRAKAGRHGGQLPLVRLRDALDGQAIR